ncbi:MAG: LacI family DNA-binding transcriptional regulator [Lachnospiraceae bacterium]|nr:LacI family DNA-binding transcriptional regulator [Lachnospiraceae bacterium]
MGVTLQQIADMAGVHKSTVDKVIHNRPGVSDAKRQMIKKLLEENHYESNPLAKALNYQKKKMKVAVILPEVDSTPFLKAGMELVRQDFNSFNIEVQYDILNFSNKEEKINELSHLKKEEISGVVLMPLENEVFEEIQQLLKKNEIPVVTINTEMIDGSQLCYVGQDCEQQGKIAARMLSLFKPGGANLGIISRHHMRSVRIRENSLRSYLTEISNIIPPEETVYIVETAEDAYNKTKEYLLAHPETDALYLTCGRVADICRAVEDLGRADRMTVICYEGYPEIMELIKRGRVACSIANDLMNQGRLAMRLLFEYLIYEKESESKVIYISNRIILKENA